MTSYQVRTNIQSVELPDGNYYPNANTVVTLTDADYHNIDPAMYTRGWLTDLGIVSGAFPESAVANLTADLAAKLPLTGGTLTGALTLAGDPTTNLGAATRQYVHARQPSINVKDPAYGAVGDGVTDDTAAINAAISAAGTAGGGIVFFPPGTYLSSGVPMRSYVTLGGCGDASVIKLKDGTNGDLITNFDSSVQETTIEKLLLDGNKSFNGTAACRGIAYTADTSATSVGRHRLFDLFIRNFSGEGLRLDGTHSGTSDIRNVRVYLCDGYGIWLSSSHDNIITGCDVGQAGLSGYRIDGSNNRLIGCNAWFSGRVTPSNGTGFTIPSGGSRSLLSGCQAQDSQLHGFVLFGCSNVVLSGCIADGCNANGEGVSSGLAGNGFQLNNATDCTVQGAALNRFATRTTRYAVEFAGTTNGCRVDMQTGPMLLGSYTGTPSATATGQITSSNGNFNTTFEADPLALGMVTTISPGVLPTAQTYAGANDCRYARVLVGGVISKIGMNVVTSSGNISVAAYRGTGAGRSRVPGTQLLTSGAVACPATGYQEVSLGASVYVAPGDFLALSCDNTTASFSGFGGFTSGLFGGVSYGQATAHPAPSTPSTFATTSRVPALTGAP